MCGLFLLAIDIIDYMCVRIWIGAYKGGMHTPPLLMLLTMHIGNKSTKEYIYI